MLKANVIIVKEFLSNGSKNPPSLAEVQAFWKVCTDAERQQFADEARRLDSSIDPPVVSTGPIPVTAH